MRIILEKMMVRSLELVHGRGRLWRVAPKVDRLFVCSYWIYQTTAFDR